jgi:hypothetical protein
MRVRRFHIKYITREVYMSKRMRVTLMTDASVCPMTKAGGFGFWCVSDRDGGYSGGGTMKGDIIDSFQGEIKAVANALYHCIREGKIRRNDVVLVQLDNY